ncbi:MAG TPA: SCO family protein [Bacillota bacterium]|nr:SCO family protein [Bacillota bacterium]
MKKFYITFVILLIIGIGSGIYYLEVVRPGNAELPEDIVMETAFDGEYAFGDMDKKVRIIEFMYVNCPDVCPVTTLEMSKLRNSLEEEGVFGDKVEFITITINPRDDTQEVLQEYAGRFEVTSDDDGWKFLRSTEENTKEVADSLGFLYRDPGNGDMVHSTYAYFLDEKNNLIEKFTMGDAFDTDRAYKRIMNTIN